MALKNKIFSVVASTALVASSFVGTFAGPTSVDAAAMKPTKDAKTSINSLVSKEIYALAASDQEVQELMIVANELGQADMTAQLESLGVEVLSNTGNFIYLAEVPTRKIMDVFNLKGVATLGKNSEYTLDRVVDPEFGETEVDASDFKPNMGNTHDVTNVDGFHKEYDGTGVTIAVLDTGIDPGHPAFDGRVIGSRDFTFSGKNYGFAEGDVLFLDAYPEGDSFDGYNYATGMNDITYNTTGMDAASDVYYLGYLWPQGYQDMNDDGYYDREFAVLLVDDMIYIDTNQNSDFTDEVAYGMGDVGYFGNTEFSASFQVSPHTVDSGLGQLELRHNDVTYDGSHPFDYSNYFPIVNIFFDGDGHGTHVSGMAAGGYGQWAPGVAPNADLVGLRVFDSNARAFGYGIANAMYYAALPVSEGGFGADIVNMSLGSKPDVNDGSGIYAQIIEKMGEKYDTIYVTSAGNAGPGLDTVGSPGDALKAISVGAYINSTMWENQYGYMPYEGFGEGLWYFSSKGPAEDGKQKPDIVAPGSAWAAFPSHLPFYAGGYGIARMQGTSMSSPYVAGALASLKHAVQKDRIPFNYEIALEALIQTAQPLDGYTRVEVGAGLIDVQAAYDYLSTHFITDIKNVDVTYYHGEKVAGGPGLYVRNKDLPEYVDVLIENNTDEAKDLTLTSNADWATPLTTSVSLNPGESTLVTVHYNKDLMSVGVNDGTILIDDASTPYVEMRSHQTIVVGQEFNSDNHHRTVNVGEVLASQTTNYYFDVKPGTSEIRFALNAIMESGEYKGRVRMMVFNPDGKEVSAYQGYAGFGNGGLVVEENVYTSPKPGVWEVAVYGSPGGTGINEFRLRTFVQGVVNNGNIELGLVDGGHTTTETVTFDSYLSTERDVKLAGGKFSSAMPETTRQTVGNHGYYYEVVSLKNNVLLKVDTSNPSDAGDDIDLYVYSLDENGYISDLLAISGRADSNESVTLNNLPDGDYLIEVYGYATMDEYTDFDLTITNASVLPYDALGGEGNVTVPTGTHFLEVGQQLSADVTITTPDVAGSYLGGVFLLDANTNEVLSIIPITTDMDKIDVVAGSNRISTSVEISKEMYPNGYDVNHPEKAVVLVTGYGYADALSAGPLAASLEAPILLVGKNGMLSDNVTHEIARLGAEKVVIIGGTGVIKDDVLAELNTIGIDSANITRYAGKNRYATNMAVVNALGFEDANGIYQNGVFLATGENYADALSAASIAAERNMPIVLVKGSLTDEAKDLLTGQRVFVLGGTSAVSADVYAEAKAVANQIERIGGVNRYDTGAKIQNRFAYAVSADRSDVLFVASGKNFPDALAAAPYVALYGGTFILVGDSVSVEMDTFLTKYLYMNYISEVKVIGGDNAVNSGVRAELNSRVN
ncbi:cell wall-binding repeat-containing protein [Lottiidibacillus patelloidae]|nr:cell wall-binding repeat-containing protein [Lottiidibacillus patelloidae]